MSEDRGYRILNVAGDGDCGYTAFGITRDRAYQLVTNNINNIRDIIQPVLREQLVELPFFQYLQNKEVIGLDISFEHVENNIDQYAQDLNITNAYVDFALPAAESKLWPHPAMLHALASIQNINLRIWEKDKDNGKLLHLHHYDEKFYEHRSHGGDEWTDLLFINGNHFERLDIQWGKKGDDGSPIYPFPVLVDNNNNNDNHNVNAFNDEEDILLGDDDYKNASLMKNEYGDDLDSTDPYTLAGKIQLEALLALTLRPESFCDFAKKYINALGIHYNQNKLSMGEEAMSTLALNVCVNIKHYVTNNLEKKHIKKYNEIDGKKTTWYWGEKSKKIALIKHKKIIQNRVTIIMELLKGCYTAIVKFDDGDLACTLDSLFSWPKNLPFRYKRYLLWSGYNMPPERNGRSPGFYLYRYNKDQINYQNGEHSVNKLDEEMVLHHNDLYYDVYVLVAHKNSHERFALSDLLAEGVDSVTKWAADKLNALPWPQDQEDDKIKLGAALECLIKSCCIDTMRFKHGLEPNSLKSKLKKLHKQEKSFKMRRIRLVGIDYGWFRQGRKEQYDKIEEQNVRIRELEGERDELGRILNKVDNHKEALLNENGELEDQELMARRLIDALIQENEEKQSIIEEQEIKLAGRKNV